MLRWLTLRLSAAAAAFVLGSAVLAFVQPLYLRLLSELQGIPH